MCGWMDRRTEGQNDGREGVLLFHLLDFIYRGSLFSKFTTLIYHKILINNKTEQDTEQDKHTKLLMEQFTYILTQYI